MSSSRRPAGPFRDVPSLVATAWLAVGLAFVAPDGVAKAQAIPDAGADASERPRAEITARPGQGVTIRGGDAYALTIRSRIQLRDTLVVDDDYDGATLRRRNEIAVRALRLSMFGHVIDPHLEYGLQLAFAPSDLEKSNPSPLYDAYVAFTRSRVASAKVGQFLVPFDRARTTRGSALQSIGRTSVVQELTLDRDVGVSVYSADLLGDGGTLGYQVGVFGGEGKNRIGGDRLGFLYTARLSYRPFGAFDEDSEGDLARTTKPKLLVGLAGAYAQNAQRVRGTSGTDFLAMSPDYVWGDVDTVFRYRGLSLMSELVFRYSSTFRKPYATDDQTAYEYTERALGYLLQGSYAFERPLELWGRYEELHTPWASSQAYAAKIHDQGRTLSGGLNHYLNGHAFKLQLQASQTFAYGGRVRDGRTQVMLQLDATF